AATKRLDVLEVHGGPYRCLGIRQLLACPDDLRLPEAGKEHRQVALPDSGAAAEPVQGLEEVFPVIEGDAERSPDGELVAAHPPLLISVLAACLACRPRVQSDVALPLCYEGEMSTGHIIPGWDARSEPPPSAAVGRPAPPEPSHAERA